MLAIDYHQIKVFLSGLFLFSNRATDLEALVLDSIRVENPFVSVNFRVYGHFCSNE